MSEKTTPCDGRSQYTQYRPHALRLAERYDFGARIISRMLLIDCNVQVPVYVLQKWLHPQKLNGLKK